MLDLGQIMPWFVLQYQDAPTIPGFRKNAGGIWEARRAGGRVPQVASVELDYAQ
jgi:hypothetical protein